MPPDTDLLKAASAGDLSAVSLALEAGANVNAKDEYNNTPLNGAAMSGHVEVVKRLLDAGADIENKGSGGGLTPLANAATHGRFDVAQLLVDRGARVTDDLLSVLQLKVEILEENAESGMVLPEGVAAWKQVREFFITQRMRQDVPDAVPRLSSSDAAMRKAVAGGMAEAGKRGVDLEPAAAALADLLSDGDAETRSSASGALTYHRGRTGDWAGVQTLLASQDSRMRLAACDAVISLEPADVSLVDALGTLLHDGEAEVRTSSALAVSALPRKGVDATSLVPRMIELLGDAEPTVRRSAAFGFLLWSKQGRGDYCAPALPALRTAAESDDNDAVRHFAGQVLAASAGGVLTTHSSPCRKPVVQPLIRRPRRTEGSDRHDRSGSTAEDFSVGGNRKTSGARNCRILLPPGDVRCLLVPSDSALHVRMVDLSFVGAPALSVRGVDR